MTLTEIETALAEWQVALSAVSRGQSYSIEGRSLTRADLGDIRDTIDWLDGKRAAAIKNAGGGGRVFYVG